MGTDSTSRTLVTLFVLVLLGWAVWLVWDVLPPFLIATALALLLDPLMDRMQKRGLPRWLAVLLTFSGFLLLFFGVIAYLLPRAIGQVAELLGNSNAYAARFQAAADAWAAENADLLRRLNLPPSLQDLWEQHQGELTAWVQRFLQGIFAAFQQSLGRLGWLIVIPLVTLYLLMDLDALQARLVYLVPEARREAAVDLAARVGAVFAAYLRGLTLICAAYGTVVYLVLGLGFALPYALILGLLAAALYAVPYLGQLGLLLGCAGVAWATGRSPGFILGVVAALVVVGQIFDQLITPRFFGRQVGLHPVLGLFALMAGGQLFGLAGMVMAVPVAAAARVVLIQLFPRLTEPIPGFEKRGRAASRRGEKGPGPG